MPLIPGICPNCGATLEIDGDKDAAICRYCDTPFVVEKAVKLYNNTYNIHGEVVNIFGGPEKDFLIRGGVLEKYNGEATEVIIPDNVKAIGNEVFAGLQITEITFPKGVESIGDRAFSQCDKLQNIQLPNGLKSLGKGCFSLCSMLQEITLPTTLETLGSGCFSSCSMLQKIQLPTSLRTLGDACFADCTSLRDIIIPSNVAVVPYRCFENCASIKNVTLSENLVKIAPHAFDNCKALETICLPSTLQEIGTFDLGSFIGCRNIKEVILPFDYQKAFIACSLNLEKYSITQHAILCAFRDTPWYEALVESCNKIIDEALTNRKCPYCGSKLSLLFRKCKCCNKEYPK